MILIKPSPEKLSNVLRHAEKVQLIMDWVREFRFSTVDILSEVIGASRPSTLKLLGDLVDDRYLIEFKNRHISGIRLFCLGASGRKWLETWSRDTSKAVFKSSSLARTGKLLHHICVQKMALKYSKKFEVRELTWDVNIVTKAAVRPDLILRSHGGHVAALEFDRTTKNEHEFYDRMVAMHEAIMEGGASGYYDLGIIAVESPITLARYQTYFNASEWPIMEKNKHRKPVPTGRFLTPSAAIKKAIIFESVKDEIEQLFVGRQRQKMSMHSRGNSIEMTT